MSGITLHDDFEKYGDGVEEKTLAKYHDIRKLRNQLNEMLEIYETTMDGEKAPEQFEDEIMSLSKEMPKIRWE